MTDCTLHRHCHLYTNTVSSLLLSSLLFVFFSSAYPQTDTAQLYNTHTDSCTHMDRTGLEFILSLRNKNSSHCHLDIIHGSGASLLRLLVYRNHRSTKTLRDDYEECVVAMHIRTAQVTFKVVDGTEPTLSMPMLVANGHRLVCRGEDTMLSTAAGEVVPLTSDETIDT